MITFTFVRHEGQAPAYGISCFTEHSIQLNTGIRQIAAVSCHTPRCCANLHHDVGYPLRRLSMSVQDIEYIELYAANEKRIIDYFMSSLGFALVAESADNGRNSVLLRHGDLQIVVTSGRGTEEFLDAHGDGVADVALTCADVTATRDAVMAAGAVVAVSAAGHPVAPGFGGCRHTLLPATGHTGRRPPAGWRWTAARQVPDRARERILLLDHVAICLEGGTLQDYADFYESALGLGRYFAEYVELGDQAMDSIVVRSPSRDVTFTLVCPDTGKGPGQLDAFLERNGGPGVQHLAFAVDDIVGAVHEFRRKGVEFLRTPTAYYDLLADRFSGMKARIADLRAADVLADRDEWGYLLQIFTRSPCERNTLFYELIERRGALGFGSANIRALYEAVERDRLSAE
jgi:4-hydroxymandelate synthase